jgi:hypothetical protein
MHNTRKKHNKYNNFTRKRIDNKRTRFHKRNLRHTRHKPRHNITHKQRGAGILDRAKEFVNQTSTFLNKKEDKQQLKENAEAYSKTSDLSVGAQNRSDIIKAAAGASLLTTIARVAVVGLSASGAGLPLAGVIATALIIAHVFAEMNISNINLKSVMYDTLNIISNSYILNDYIDYVEKHMTNNNILLSQETIDISKKPPENPNQIIVGLKSRLKDKITGLISYLLSIATDDMLASLKRDKSATQAIRDLVDAENANRKGFFAFMARAGRVVDRTLKADRTISYIIRDISIINGYFMLVKSHFDLSVDVFERALGTGKDKFWETVANEADDNTEPTNQGEVANGVNKANNPYTRYLYGGFNDEKVASDANTANSNDLVTIVDKKTDDTTAFETELNK